MSPGSEADAAHPGVGSPPPTPTSSTAPAAVRLRRLLVAVVVPLVVATVTMLVVLWPPRVDTGASTEPMYRGEVVAVDIRDCPQAQLPETPSGLAVTRCGTMSRWPMDRMLGRP